MSRHIPSPPTFDVTITFTSDWGVGSGAGTVGGVDQRVERDARGRPVVRATTLTGVISEQVLVAAHALDSGNACGPWSRFAQALFGRPRDDGSTRLRLVTFSDAEPTQDVSIHEVISVSIDPDTGAAKKDHLRMIERAAPCVLRAQASFVDVDREGNPLSWTHDQLEIAQALLCLGAMMVPAIGSDKTNGDGACEIQLAPIGATEDPRTWTRRAIKKWVDAVERGTPLPDAPTALARNVARIASAETTPSPQTWFRAEVTIALDTPVVSYDVPMSNEVRSLDFLRGTVVLAWLHRRLRAAFPDDEIVRDAVVNGDLFVSDATAVLNGVRGLPMPLVFTRPRGDEDAPVWNRYRTPPPRATHSPIRHGFVHWDAAAERVPVGRPPLVGRQSTAHDPSTGTASSGQLFLVRALSQGLTLQGDIRISDRLHRVVGNVLAGMQDVPAHMGSRRLSGTFGRVRCSIGPLSAEGEAPAVLPDRDGALTLWFTSDLLLRSASLAHGAGASSIVHELDKYGVLVDWAEALSTPEAVEGSEDEGAPFRAGIRYRRVDSWATNTGTPRPTRLAIQAGSTIRVRPRQSDTAEATLRTLVALSRAGIGELRAQGFGRFVVGHPLLDEATVKTRQVRAKEYTSSDRKEN